MLIKICEGTQLDSLPAKIETGTLFLRYLFPDVYDRGSVVAVGMHTVTVDFADTVREFATANVTLVFGGAYGEHLMSRSEGAIVKDYRQTHKEVPQIDNLEDLLDFDKWFA